MKQVGRSLDDIDFQGNAQFGAVVQHPAVVVGNASGAEVYVKVFIKLAFLFSGPLLRAGFRDNASTPDSKVAAPCVGLGLQHIAFES